MIFRCQFCAAVPDPETQQSLERQLRELVCGEYLDALPGRWLVWHGRGPFGPTRYACAEHRGDLTAYLREHYGTLGWQPWKMPPYPITRRSRDTDRALRLRALSPGSSLGAARVRPRTTCSSAPSTRAARIGASASSRADDPRAHAAELRSAAGWGPTARVATVAQAWRELADEMAAGRRGDGRRPRARARLGELAERLWVVPPGGSLLR